MLTSFLLTVSSLVVLTTSCSTSSTQTEKGKYTVQCVNMVANCHDRARSLCPDGYLVTNRVRPRKVNNNTEFTLGIRCRQPIMY